MALYACSTASLAKRPVSDFTSALANAILDSRDRLRSPNAVLVFAGGGIGPVAMHADIVRIKTLRRVVWGARHLRGL
eukprot:4941194-Alexandrium_andersonii.AAC.1